MNRFFRAITNDSNMSAKLILSFGLLIAIVLCLGLLGLKHVRADVELEAAIDGRQNKAQLSRKALDLSNLNNRITMQVFLIEDEKEINLLLEQRARNTEKISALIQTLKTKVESSEESRLLDAIDQNRVSYVESYKRALHLLIDEKKPVDARTVMIQQALPDLLTYHAAWNAYVKYQSDQLDQAQSGVSSGYLRLRIEALLLIALAVAVSLAIAFFVTRNLTRHMSRRRAAEQGLRQARDDLEIKVAGRTSELAAKNEQLYEEIEARKLVVDELRSSEERYRLLFESNPRPMWVYDQDTLGFLAVNDAAVHHYGYSRPEFLGMTIKDIRPSEDIDHLIDVLKNSAGEFGSAPSLVRHRKKDGEIIDVEISWHSLDFSGRPARLVLPHDITERKRAEREILLQKARFQQLFDKTPMGIVIVNENDLVLDVNQEFEEIFQFSAGELRGRSINEAIIPEDQIELAAKLSSRTLQGEIVEDETLRQRKDGSLVPVHVYGVPIISNHRTTGCFAIYIDLTERKRMESEREIINEIIKSAITTADLDGFLALAHQAISRHLYAENCFVALYDEATEMMHFPFWVDKLDPCPTPRPIGIGFSSYVLRTGKSMLVSPELTEEMHQRGEVQKSGSASASWLGVPLLTSSRTIGVLVVQHYEEKDVYDEHDKEFLTAVGSQIALAIERKRAETTLRETEDQLRQSQKMESIGTLAGGIAHDFNNLMTVVTGYSELALRHLALEDSLRAKIEEIKKAGERAASLTRQLLAFSRKQMLQPKVLDLNAVVSGVGKMLTRVIGDEYDLRLELDASLGQVEADPGQMEQIILNLAVNARDAMPNGGYLTIKTENVSFDGKFSQRRAVLEPGKYVMLSVSDNGCGMDAETQQHIFEPFFTTKEVGKGTGLGLSTVYGIVKQSGGSIWVYSEVGRGTTLKIYFPRVDGFIEAPASTEKSRLALRGSETILLVEDEETVRDLSKEILEQYGYAVITASDGKEGLKICEEFDGNIDLIITDVVMPQMGGRQLAETIGPFRPNTRVLFMSGFTDDAVVRHGVLDDGVSFIQKPFSPDFLAVKAREVLDGRGAHQY